MSTKQTCTWSVLVVYVNILLVDVSKGVHRLREKHDEMFRPGLPNTAESCKIAKSLQYSPPAGDVDSRLSDILHILLKVWREAGCSTCSCTHCRWP